MTFTYMPWLVGFPLLLRSGAQWARELRRVMDAMIAEAPGVDSLDEACVVANCLIFYSGLQIAQAKQHEVERALLRANGGYVVTGSAWLTLCRCIPELDVHVPSCALPVLPMLWLYDGSVSMEGLAQGLDAHAQRARLAGVFPAPPAEVVDDWGTPGSQS